VPLGQQQKGGGIKMRQVIAAETEELFCPQGFNPKATRPSSEKSPAGKKKDPISFAFGPFFL
jgi:hypothetical protein